MGKAYGDVKLSLMDEKEELFEVMGQSVWGGGTWKCEGSNVAREVDEVSGQGGYCGGGGVGRAL